jgi:N-acetylmuramoyl-L-alanine amidase
VVAQAAVAAPSPSSVALAPTPDSGDQMAASPEPMPTATTFPSPEGSPTAAAPAVVTAVDETQADQSFALRIAVSAPANYEWHRLLDGRWYIDVQNATLGMAPLDDAPVSDDISSVRVRQMALDPIPIVRVALTLPPGHVVDVEATEASVTLTVTAGDDTTAQRVGLGEVGDAGPVVQAPPLPSPDALASAWKFGPRAANARLIVIDPGHGGSDTGAQQNGLVEKDLTLDISERLRTLLVARGWSVKLTRESDVDVYAPNDSAHDELQARCDVANAAGARMFVSIHINSFTTSDLKGTTTYYYKSEDLPLAQAVHRRLIAALGTSDDGVRKDNFYVIHHTTMPAILIETAFMSNPDDAALLRSPSFLQKVALSVADGVGDYAGAPPPPQTSMDTR